MRAYLLAAERENDTSWEIPDLSPGVAENCRDIATQQITQVLRGGELNGGNLCSYYDVPNEIKRLDGDRRQREGAVDSGRARRAREAEILRESDELSRYCESVNYVGDRCRGL